MKYAINPCTACKARLGSTDISGLANCCATIASSFGVSTDVCASCVDQAKVALGRDLCQYSKLGPGVPWVQVPAYFPVFFQQSGNKADALARCLQACQSAREPKECAMNCELCAAAVEELVVSTDQPTTAQPQQAAFIPRESPDWGAVLLAIVVVAAFALFVLLRRK